MQKKSWSRAIVSKRGAESAHSKAEAAKALLAASKKSKNPIKLFGGLFGGIFVKLVGMFKWLWPQTLKIIGVLGGLVRRLKKDAPVATPEAAQPNQPSPAPTYEPIAEPPPAGGVAPASIGPESSPPTQDMPPAPTPEPLIPVAPIPVAPIPAAPIPAAPLPQTPVTEIPSVAERQIFPDPPVVPSAPPVTPAEAQSTVETPIRASDLLPQPIAPEPQSMVVSTADETTLTAAFEQELRNAQQAETQLHELKVKAAATALQKGSLAAARSVEEALPWYEKAAELDPASTTAQLGLSRLYKQSGNLLGAFEAAQKAFAGTDDQQTQALALEGMDQVIVAKSDEPVVPEIIAPEPVAPEPAPRTFEEIRRLLDADPDNPDLQRDLSIAYDEIGDQHAEQDNLVGALECFEASMMVVGRLAKANPDTIAYLRDFSVCNEKIGEVQNALGNREAAIAAYEESLPIVTMLANRFPEEEEYLFDLKITKDRLAELKTLA